MDVVGFSKQAIWVLPENGSAASESRRHVFDASSGMADETRETAVLLAHEMVVNAFEHGQAPVALIVARTGDRLRVEVQDQNPSPPTLVDPDSLSERGRGMQLVEALSACWGTGPCPEDAPGKRVWFEI